MFTALSDLPGILTDMGYQVEVTDGWIYGQGDYLWTDPWDGSQSEQHPPSCYMVHHTAGKAATPPPAATSKANAWIGFKSGDRLYSHGTGAPTIVLSTAGPARISSGYGYRPAAWDYTFQDVRAPWKAEGPDGDTALNRYAFNVEVVHPGDGIDLHPGVFDAAVGLGVALHEMFGWRERTLGHVSWTRRKLDPYWSTGRPNDGLRCIIDVQDTIAGRLEMDLFTVGEESKEFEEVSWLLFIQGGGTVNPNKNSSQVTEILPWKTNVRLCQVEDLEMIATLTGMFDHTREAFIAGGMYRWGKEMAALRQVAYTGQ